MVRRWSQGDFYLEIPFTAEKQHRVYEWRWYFGECRY